MQTFDEAGWNARVETIPEKDPLKYLGPLALKNLGVAWDSMQTPLSCGVKSVKHLATGLMSRFGTVLMPGCRGLRTPPLALLKQMLQISNPTFEWRTSLESQNRFTHMHENHAIGHFGKAVLDFPAC